MTVVSQQSSSFFLTTLLRATYGTDTEQQHGMFTYYLLKKLQETNGDVTLQELGDYIVSNVKQQSLLENNRIQTPSVTPASAVTDEWKNWKLK